VLASTLVIFVAQAISLFVIGRIFYGTPFPSAIGSLILAVILGAASFAGLGVATASLIRSAEGSSAVVNFILLPMAFLTGSFGPTRHYPAFLRAIGDVLPLKYFIEIMNAVYLRGNGLWTKPAAIGVLAAWGASGLIVSALKFRWEPREG
jgi:ABC-2 type transport system permease protein